jgi:hypothetical protein
MILNIVKYWHCVFPLLWHRIFCMTANGSMHNQQVMLSWVITWHNLVKYFATETMLPLLCTQVKELLHLSLLQYFELEVRNKTGVCIGFLITGEKSWVLQKHEDSLHYLALVLELLQQIMFKWLSSWFSAFQIKLYIIFRLRMACALRK